MPAPYTIAQMIQNIRVMAGDTNTSHRVFPDNLTALVTGSRTFFPLSNQNIQTGTQYSVDGGNLLSGDALVTDFVNGFVTLGAAPQATLEWYYYFIYCTDTEVTQFADDGLAEVGMNETNLTTIDPTLFDVASTFAAAKVCQRMAQKFAENFNSTVEGESFQMSDVYKAYMNSEKTFFTRATDKREEFYKRQGRRFSPASAQTVSNFPPNRQLPRR